MCCWGASHCAYCMIFQWVFWLRCACPLTLIRSFVRSFADTLAIIAVRENKSVCCAEWIAYTPCFVSRSLSLPSLCCWSLLRENVWQRMLLFFFFFHFIFLILLFHIMISCRALMSLLVPSFLFLTLFPPLIVLFYVMLFSFEFQP